MPKRRMRKRKGHTQPKHAHKQHQAPMQQNLIAVKNQTIIVYGAGDSKVNGVYEHKCLEEDYFERIGSVQSRKHANNDSNDVTSDMSKSPSKSDAKFEIDRREYLKNPDDIPDAKLHKSGVWILSRVDVYPKQLLYAVNCPFKSKIKMNDWIVLKDGESPAPHVKLFETKQISHTPKKKQKNNVHDAIKEIRSTHHDTSGNKLNKMQIKALKKKGNISHNKGNKIMIVCGGQTGVDRAVLDMAIALDIPYGGWIPKGRKADDGVIDADKYSNLKECDSEEYEVRTLLNVVDSDATLILNMGVLEGGTLTTKKYVSQKNKDLMYITLFAKTDEEEASEEHKMNDNDEPEPQSYSAHLGFADGRAQRVSEWIRCRKIKVLNIAGPRESDRKGIYDASVQFLTNVLKHFEHGLVPDAPLYG
eukprot:13396_1